MIFGKEQKQKTNLTFIRAVCILALAAIAGACAGTEEPVSPGEELYPTQDFETIDQDVDDQVAPGEVPTREPSICPGLDSMLTQVYQSPEPLIQAQQLQIRTEGEKIQVLLILEGGETSFLKKYSVDISKQSGNQAQAYVPIEHLCAAANSDGVLAIRTIQQIIVD